MVRHTQVGWYKKTENGLDTFFSPIRKNAFPTHHDFSCDAIFLNVKTRIANQQRALRLGVDDGIPDRRSETNASAVLAYPDIRGGPAPAQRREATA